MLDVSDVLSLVKSFPHYLGVPKILKTVRWQTTGNAAILWDDATKEEVAVVVLAKVSGNKLYAKPVGAYTPDSTFGTIADSKYRITVGPPDDMILKKEYFAAIKTVQALQDKVAKTESKRYLLEDIDGALHLRLSLPVFSKRETPIVENVVYLDDIENPVDGVTPDPNSPGEELDDETANYPVPDNLREAYDSIKSEYSVNLLPVYDKDTFVSPEDVQSTIDGALVEVHFAVKHYKIFGKPPYDCYSGLIRQIVVHQRGSPPSVPQLKRKNIRDGPIRPPPAKRVVDNPFPTSSPTDGRAATTEPASISDKKSSVSAVDGAQAVTGKKDNPFPTSSPIEGTAASTESAAILDKRSSVPTDDGVKAGNGKKSSPRK